MLLGMEAKVPVDDVLQRLPLVTDTEEACVELYQTLDRAGCPLDAFDKVVAVIRKHRTRGFGPQHQIPSRATLMKKLEKKFGAPKPEVVNTVLENGMEDNPEQYTVGFHDQVNVVRWDAKELVMDLLQDMGIFGDAANLAVNPEDPFGPYVPVSESDGEIHAHKWYRDTYHQVINDPGNELLLGIIVGNDKTGVDANQRFGGEPFLLSLSIIKGSVRRLGKCWRVLGYLPDLDQGSSAKKKQDSSRKAGKGRSQRNYHKCAEIILSSLKLLEEGFETFMRIGDRIRFMRIKCRIAFVFGDGKNGDVLCNRFLGKRCQRICRACHVDHPNLDNCLFECEFLKASDMNNLYNLAVNGDASIAIRTVNTKKLHAISTHVCRNAFSDRDFGANKHGITLGTPSDMMHLFELGIMKYLLGVFVSSMTTSVRTAVDSLIERLYQSHRSSEKKHHLRMNFVRGATQLTLLASHEWIGLASSMLVMLLSNEGSLACSSCFQDDDILYDGIDEENIAKICVAELPTFDMATIQLLTKDPTQTQQDLDVIEEFSMVADDESLDGEDDDSQHSDDPNDEEEDVHITVGSNQNGLLHETYMNKPESKGKIKRAQKLKCSRKQFVSLLEDLLIFHSWYKRDESPLPHNATDQDVQQLNVRIRKLVHRLITFCPRNDGHGWKLQKLHEMFHLPVAALYFGRTDNWDACHLERNLKTFVKAVARICQKRVQPEYIKQMGRRVYEKSIISKAAYAAESQRIISPSTKGESTAATQGFLGRPKYSIKMERLNGDTTFTFQWHGTQKGVTLHHLVLDWFQKAMRVNVVGQHIIGFTEMTAMDPSATAFKIRAHPNYRGPTPHEVGNSSPWHDWALIRFHIDNPTADDEEENEHLFPGKIMALYRDVSFNDIEEQDRAVVFCSNFQQESVQERLNNGSLTRLCERWEGWTEEHPTSRNLGGLRYIPKLMDVPLTSIVKPLMVIEENGTVLQESYAFPPKFWVIRRRKRLGDEEGWEGLKW